MGTGKCKARECDETAVFELLIEDFMGYGFRRTQACAAHAEPEAGVEIIEREVIA